MKIRFDRPKSESEKHTGAEELSAVALTKLASPRQTTPQFITQGCSLRRLPSRQRR